MNRLQGKSAIITGGASGIGAATARLFVAEGARVLIADTQDEKGARLANALGASAAYRHADVGIESDIEGLINDAMERFGRLDCLFSNAGLAGVAGPIDKIPLEGYEATMGVLLRGVFLGMKHAAPIMKQQKSGSIINTASVAGLQAGYASHIYSAAKAAVIHLTRSVAMELGEAGVRVNCICPGGIATPIFGKAFGLTDEVADQAVKTMQTVLAQSQPIRRSGLPDDIAQAALWLASDEASFVNGHALIVDGGLVGGRMWSAVEQQRATMRAALGAESRGS
jgi:NAD(P)-dependent dehydrogenase (short-subunit alcohol dehydrogenase family)